MLAGQNKERCSVCLLVINNDSVTKSLKWRAFVPCAGGFLYLRDVVPSIYVCCGLRMQNKYGAGVHTKGGIHTLLSHTPLLFAHQFAVFKARVQLYGLHRHFICSKEVLGMRAGAPHVALDVHPGNLRCVILHDKQTGSSVRRYFPHVKEALNCMPLSCLGTRIL